MLGTWRAGALHWALTGASPGIPAHPEGQRPLPAAPAPPPSPHSPRLAPLSSGLESAQSPQPAPAGAPSRHLPRPAVLKGSGPACGGSHTLPFPSGAGTPLRVQTQRLGARDARVRRRRRDGGEWAPSGPRALSPLRAPHPCLPATPHKPRCLPGALPLDRPMLPFTAVCIGAYCVPSAGLSVLSYLIKTSA